ncbi:MAG: methylmalonyl Co-A mutase-associated GTPase MeaB [Rickettsiales bacterium]
MVKVMEFNRASLAKSITLIESTKKEHQEQAQGLLSEILPKTGNSLRIGITGVPGVGKSTFIETFGLHIIEQGHKVAVLAIDPSSIKTGGSILGDKTRMAKLAQHESAFIRPSPTSGSLGGVARRTREAMLLCEAAGYDVIIIETVGVGQSETEVADMVDMFMLLLLPGSGDELQGIKKGIVELADLIVVNKADGDLQGQAKRVRADYSAALKMLHPANNSWQPKAVTCSALENKNISDIWQTACDFRKIMTDSKELANRRSGQAVSWMWKEIKENLVSGFINNTTVKNSIKSTENEVSDGNKPATQAAMELLKLYKNS